jgi:cytosine/adenosine deaminase-related metal-dependent hydrolase
MKKAIIHTTIYDYLHLIQDGYVIFDDKIIEVGPMEAYLKEKDVVEIIGKDHLVLPNFVNGHSHIYSTFARGISLPFDPKDFYDILKQIWWKIDQKLNLEMIYYSGIASSVDYIKHGVTTIIDHHASGHIKGSLLMLKKSVCQVAGLRGIFAFETSDRFDVKTSILENKRFIKNNQTEMTRGLFGLHASLSLSDQTLKKVKANLGQTPIHVHVAESALDQEYALRDYQKRVIHRFFDFGLLNPNSILSHAIHVNQDEIDIIKKTNCVVAVNVTSNMNNAVGLPNISLFRKHKIPMIIGNDGISRSMANEYLSVYYTAHHQDKNPKTFTHQDLLDMIRDTYQYASLTLNTKLGKIEKGYEADILMIPYINPTPISKDNMFGHLFYGLYHGFKPKHVFVKGNYVLKNYEVKPSLINQYKKAIHFSTELWQTLSKEEKNES